MPLRNSTDRRARIIESLEKHIIELSTEITNGECGSHLDGCNRMTDMNKDLPCDCGMIDLRELTTRLLKWKNTPAG